MPDAFVLAIGVALLLSGVFSQKNVTISESAPGIDAALPTPPPLNYIKGMTAIAQDTAYALDVIEQKTINTTVAGRPSIPIAKDVETTLIGWAVDSPARRAADSVYVLLDGRPVTACHISIPRPDVAAALGDPAFASSGFACAIPPERIVRGTHRIVLDIVAQGGHTYYVASPTARLVVR